MIRGATSRYLLRRFSGVQHARHAETQLVPRDEGRRRAAARCASLSAHYPTDIVALVRAGRVLAVYRNGTEQRVTPLHALQRLALRSLPIVAAKGRVRTQGGVS